MTSEEIEEKIAAILEASPLVKFGDIQAQDIILIGDRWKHGYVAEIDLRQVFQRSFTQVRHLSIDKMNTDVWTILTNKAVVKSRVSIRRICREDFAKIAALQKLLKQAEEKNAKRTLHGNDRYILWNYAFERVGQDDLSGFILEVYSGNGKLLARVRMIAVEDSVVEDYYSEKTDRDEAMARAYANLYRDKESIDRGNVFQIHYVKEMD